MPPQREVLAPRPLSGARPGGPFLRRKPQVVECAIDRSVLRGAREGNRPQEGSETLNSEQLALERCYLGLRTKRGIDLEDLPLEARPAVRQLCKARLVRVMSGRIIPSARGFLVADSLPVLLT